MGIRQPRLHRQRQLQAVPVLAALEARQAKRGLWGLVWVVSRPWQLLLQVFSGEKTTNCGI